MVREVHKEDENLMLIYSPTFAGPATCHWRSEPVVLGLLQPSDALTLTSLVHLPVLYCELSAGRSSCKAGIR